MHYAVCYGFLTRLKQHLSLSLLKTSTLYETHPSLHVFHMDLHQKMAYWRSAVIMPPWHVRCTQTFCRLPSASPQIQTSDLRLVEASSALIRQEGHLFSSSSSVRWIWGKGQISLHQKPVWPSQLEMGRDRRLFCLVCGKQNSLLETNERERWENWGEWQRGRKVQSPSVQSCIPSSAEYQYVHAWDWGTNIRNVSSDPCPLFTFLFLCSSFSFCILTKLKSVSWVN